MASPSMAVMSPPPAPGQEGAAPPNAPAPTNPPVASPAAPKPSPQINAATGQIFQAVSIFRDIAKAYPAAAPHVQNINLEVREIMRKIMEHQEPGEPAAPPIMG